MKTNDYPNWLVSVEIAKRLKEIKFDLPSPFVLQYERAVILSGYDFYCESGYIDLEINVNEDLERVNSKEITIIPTWEQVIEWFIEKNLIGTIEYRKFDEKDPYYAYCITNKMTKVLDYSSNTTRYSSYREAREALINKLIEIYKKE